MTCGFKCSSHTTSSAILIVVAYVATLGSIQASGDAIIRRASSAAISPHGQLSGLLQDRSRNDSLDVGNASNATNVTDATAPPTYPDLSTLQGLRIHLRSCSTNLCLLVDHTDTFILADCHDGHPGQIFVATNLSKISTTETNNAANITMPTGRVLCNDGGGKVQAGEEDCSLAKIELALVPDASGNPIHSLFHVQFDPYTNPNNHDTITEAQCVRAPDSSSQLLELGPCNNTDFLPMLWTNETDKTMPDGQMLFDVHPHKDPCPHVAP
jgi:hypothetical protein